MSVDMLWHANIEREVYCHMGNHIYLGDSQAPCSFDFAVRFCAYKVAR